MIIECPACKTRYDIKAQLPSGGRTVRCAKCANVWRATAEASPEEVQAVLPAATAAETQSSFKAHAREAEYQSEIQPDQQPVQSNASGWRKESASEEAVNDDSAAAAKQSELPGNHHGISSNFGDELAATSDQSHAETAAFDRGLETSDPGDTGKIRWFSSFRRKSKTRAEANLVAAADPTLASEAEPIPFPRHNASGERRPAAFGSEDGSTLDDARQAVRSVFSSLGEVRPAGQSRVFSSPVTAEFPEEDAPDREPAEKDPVRLHLGNGIQAAWMRNGTQGETPASARSFSDWSEDADDALGASTTGDDGASPSTTADDGWDEVGDGDAHLSAEDAVRAWMQKKESPAATGDGDQDTLRDAMRRHFPESDDDGLAHDLEAHLRSKSDSDISGNAWAERAAAAWKRPLLPLDEIAEQPVSSVDDSSEARTDEGSFDPRLYKEIEERQEHAHDLRRRDGSGGLALAAAWGLFLCAASGLAVGFSAFRDMAADAVPGLAPLYRTLGVPVTVQPLIFESVQYRWTVSDNKPALLVSGSVYNRAQRKVRVPEFFITIKDEDPALDREYSANLQVVGSKIKSNQRADFEIELLSPNPTVTSVELELRNVR
jgi:predicted Zn finger-like uncharacterized protein